MSLDCLFPFLHKLEVLRQAIKTPVPKMSIALEPFENVAKRVGLEVTRTPLRVSAARDQARCFEYLQVFGNRRKAHFIGLGQFLHRGVASRQPSQDSAPGWIGESKQSRTERIRGHVFNRYIDNLLVKYKIDPAACQGGNIWRARIAFARNCTSEASICTIRKRNRPRGEIPILV